MSTQLIWTIVITTSLILLYAVIVRGFFRATEPIRASMLDLAEALINDDKFPDAEKQLICIALDDVHSARRAWMFVVTAIRVSLGLAFIPKNVGKDADVPESLQPTYNAFKLRWGVVTLANSPAAAFIFVVLGAVRASFSKSVNALLSAILKANGNDRHDGKGGHGLAAGH